MEKKPYLAAAVQTVEALEVCIEERLGLFCIEEPLYSQMRAVPAMNEIKNYDIQCHEEKRIAVVKRIRGENAFRDDDYEMVYFPLQHDEIMK